MANEEEKREQSGHHLEGDHFIIDPPKPPKSQEEIDRETRERNTEQFQKNQIATNSRLVLLNLCLVLFTTVGTAISIWQTRIAQRSSAAAEKGAEAAQQSSDTSDKAVLLAQKSERDARKSSEDQGKQSDKALRATIDNFHREQRAWISFGGAIIQFFGPTRLPYVEIRFTNTGRTPAVDVKFGINPVPIEIPRGDKQIIDKRLNEYFKGIKFEKHPTITPGPVQAYELIVTDTSEFQRKIASIKNAHSDIYVAGKILFHDVGGNDQWATFCYRFLSAEGDNIETRLCDVGNDVSYQK